jgi:hypothetical protein
MVRFLFVCPRTWARFAVMDIVSEVLFALVGIVDTNLPVRSKYHLDGTYHALSHD